MPECLVCGCTDFGEAQDGLYFCPECGTQSQDVRVEVATLDESGFKRTLKQKKDRSQKDRPVPSSDDHPLLAFQCNLKRQCDALISLGFDPSVKEAARLIWFTYLRHFGYAFRDQPLSEPNARGTKNEFSPNPQSQDPVSGSSLTAQTQKKCSSIPTTSGIIRLKKHTPPSNLILKAKRLKAAKEAAYDSFPDDDFLFAEAEEESKESKGGTVGENSAPVLENVSSMEELEAMERSMDCQQLYLFRCAYTTHRKPKFFTKEENWKALKVMAFKRSTTLGVLYLALLYTEQKILPVDIIRWVRQEKIPLGTPIDEESSKSFKSKDNIRVTFSGAILSTRGLFDSVYQLCHSLPLPPLPTPNPHTLCHIIIERLRLTACFQGLVDKAVDRVYCPIAYRGWRMDGQCVCVIIIMLRVLYGLNDRLEIEHSFYCRAAQGEEEEEGEEPTSANSLYLWEDWVQLYCDHLDETLEKGIPVSGQELSKVKDYQTYFQFCKDTIFTKGRPIPVELHVCNSLDPVFNAKVSQIFHDYNTQEKWKVGNRSTDPVPSTQHHSGAKDTRNTPKLIPLSSFVDGPKAACTTYHPLPSPKVLQRDKVFQQLSGSMQFLLSICCELIDIPLPELYRSLLHVETAFLKGTFECLNRTAQIWGLEIS